MISSAHWQLLSPFITQDTSRLTESGGGGAGWTSVADYNNPEEMIPLAGIESCHFDIGGCELFDEMSE